MTWLEAAVAVIVALGGGGGAWSLLKLRGARDQGATTGDVDASTGAQALHLALDLQTKVDALESELATYKRTTERTARLLSRIAMGLEVAAVRLRDLVEWERAGAKPPPPHDLHVIATDISTLSELIDYETHKEDK